MMRSLLLLICFLALGFSASAAPFDPAASAGIDQKPGALIPLDLPFTDADGKAVTLRGIGAGRPTVLVPVLHQCPNICGVTLDGIADAIMQLPAQARAGLAFVAFGIDPREGPDAATASSEALRLRFPDLPPIHALTGRGPDIAAVTGALGYRFARDDASGQFDHPAAVAILTPDGRLARWLYGLAPAASDLRLALTEANAGRSASIGEQLLLLCYHYDPVKGRYSADIVRGLRIGAGITLLAIAIGVGFAIRRERPA